jgi:hypothetical protein
MLLSKKTDEELKLISEVVLAQIRKDFLKKDVSYVSTSDLRCIGLKKTIKNKLEINRFLKKNLNAVSVSVGNKQMAVVKRKD